MEPSSKKRPRVSGGPRPPPEPPPKTTRLLLGDTDFPLLTNEELALPLEDLRELRKIVIRRRRQLRDVETQLDVAIHEKPRPTDGRFLATSTRTP